MGISKTRLYSLFDGYIQNRLTAQEHQELFKLLADPDLSDAIREYMDNRLQAQPRGGTKDTEGEGDGRSEEKR